MELQSRVAGDLGHTQWSYRRIERSCDYCTSNVIYRCLVDSILYVRVCRHLDTTLQKTNKKIIKLNAKMVSFYYLSNESIHERERIILHNINDLSQCKSNDRLKLKLTH